MVDRLARAGGSPVLSARSFPAARDEQCVEDVDGDFASQAALPVVLRRNRTRLFPEVFGQRRPEHDEVEVARVVCEVHGLARLRPAPEPHDLHAANESRSARDNAGERMRAQRALTSATIRLVRRMKVTIAPAMMSASANAMICPRQPASGSSVERTQATVIVAIRCGFAIGPKKY